MSDETRDNSRKTHLLPGNIQIPLKRLRGRDGDYFMGAWGDVPQNIDLSLYKIMVFDSKDYPGHMTLVIGDKKRSE